MKKFAFLFFIFLSNAAFAQNRFTKFVNNKNVQWAISSEQNFVYDSFNLNLFLRQQIAQDKIKATIIDDFETLHSIQYVSKDAIITRIDPFIDAHSKNNTTLFNEKYFNKDAANQVEAYQVLYVEKGKLKNIVNVVSPKQAVFAESNRFLGLTNAFSTGFNFARKLKRSITRNSIPIATTSLDILPKNERSKIQKSVFNKDLLSVLWPYLGKQYKLFRLDSMQFITREEFLDAYFHSSIRVQVPVYDVDGNILRTKVVTPIIAPDFFSRVTLQQEWRYSKRQNTLFNKIISVTLSIKSYDGKEIEVLKIIPQ